MRFCTAFMAVVPLMMLGVAPPVVAQSAQADVNAPDAQGTPPLHWAVRLDDAGRLYVAEHSRHRIQVYERN